MFMIPSIPVITNGISDDTSDTTIMKLHDGLKESQLIVTSTPA